MVAVGSLVDLFCVGDDHDVQRSVTGITASAPLTDAYLYVKVFDTDADANAVIAKHITVSLVTGVGQITDTGVSSGTGQMIFNLMGADTLGLAAGQPYAYAVKVKVSGGREFTVEIGQLRALQQYIVT